MLNVYIILKHMNIKWKMFLLTFITYSCIHSARTAWSSLKYALNSYPYNFSALYLGSLDMIVLFALAVSLNLFGPKIEYFGAKKFLIRGLVLLSVCVALLAILLLAKVDA